MPETATQEKVGTGLDRKEFERRVLAMKNEAQSWLPTWKDIKSYINPVRGFFDDLPNKGHAIDHKIMLDGYPRRCVRILAAGMTSGLTSPSRPWFRLGVDDPELMELDSIKLWLDNVQERMTNVFSRSNIYGVLNSIYEEIGSFGTASAIILEDPDTVIRGYNFTIGEYWLSLGPDGRVNGFARKYWRTVSQLVKEFGVDNVSPNIKAAYESAKGTSAPDRWIAVVHLIEENDSRLPDRADFKNMAYRSIQWEEGSPQNTFLRIGGYEDFSILGPRWQTTTGADVYGKGPGWDALGDCRMLQKMQRKKLLGLDKLIDPPVQKDAMVSGEVDTLPGGVTTSSASVPNAGARPVYQIKIDLGAIEESIQRTQEAIGSTFYTDLFLMLMTIERKQITAREVAERHEEKLLMLGPVLECLESELLDPLIDRTFAIMLRVGLIPDPPPELEGQDIKVEYISILAQAQKMVGTTAIEQVCSFVAQLAAVDTSVLDKIDWDEAVETYAEMIGIPARILRSAEAVAAIREAKKEAQLKMQQAQAGMSGAEAARTLSQAKLGQDKEGQNSALDAVIAALTGGKMPSNPAREAAAPVR
jgi:hypothetical protein